MQKIVFKPFDMSKERGMHIWAEMIVYLAQRCLLPCGHIDEDKAIVMINRNWPGSSLSTEEREYLHYLFGKGVGYGVNMKEQLKDVIDLADGADYCIRKVEQMGFDVYHKTITSNQQKYN